MRGMLAGLDGQCLLHTQSKWFRGFPNLILTSAFPQRSPGDSGLGSLGSLVPGGGRMVGWAWTVEVSFLLPLKLLSKISMKQHSLLLLDHKIIFSLVAGGDKVCCRRYRMDVRCW